MQNKKLLVYLEGTLFAAMATVLSFIPTGIGSSFSVSLGMVPLLFFSVRRGFVAGVFSGFLWGILHFVTGSVYMLNIYQVVIEYTITYASVGFAGLYSAKIRQTIKTNDTSKTILYLFIATIVGTLARYFWHFIAGWIFWGTYALWGMNAMVFSLVMNGLSFFATATVASIVLFMLVKSTPLIFLPKK